MVLIKNTLEGMDFEHKESKVKVLVVCFYNFLGSGNFCSGSKLSFSIFSTLSQIFLDWDLDLGPFFSGQWCSIYRQRFCSLEMSSGANVIC